MVERVRHELPIGSRRGGPGRNLAGMRDALLVALTAYAGCRPGETLALRRVEDGWESWRHTLADPGAVRGGVVGLADTRPYDLGPHTHSALMLASGMSLQSLARIQGHGIRVLDESYSEQLAEFEERGESIDPVAEIEAARALVWPNRPRGR